MDREEGRGRASCIPAAGHSMARRGARGSKAGALREGLHGHRLPVPACYESARSGVSLHGTIENLSRCHWTCCKDLQVPSVRLTKGVRVIVRSRYPFGTQELLGVAARGECSWSVCFASLLHFRLSG